MVCRQMTSSTYTHFMLKNNPLEPSWKQRLQSEFIQPYMHSLTDFLSQEYHDEKSIHPKPDQYFNALNSTPFDAVKVVILGQDPYHGEGQAHGLSFSVPHGVRIPPSLRNIFKELQHDVGIPIASHGCLQSWAAQGVLLLNSVLTVERKQAKSHQGKGWEKFTDTIIAHLNHEKKGIVFLLWGAYAQQKGMFIDQNKHLVLKSVHPSPLSAYRGFFGQHHFSQTNQYLLKMGNTPIDWSLPSGISNSL